MINRVFVFKVLMVALVLAAVVVCVGVSVEAGKFVSGDVYYVAPKINDNAYYFSLNDIEVLADAVNADRFAYQSLGSAVVSADSYNVFVGVVYTNGEYFELGGAHFARGGGWHPNRESERSAVVDGSLAWQLYGSVDVVGNDVYIGGERYYIVGVSGSGQITRDDGIIYVPMNPMPDERGIAAVFLNIGGKSGVRGEIAEALSGAGKNPLDYYVTDINRYAENITLNYKLLFFLIGIYAALIIILNSYKLFRRGRASGKTWVALAALFLADIIVIVLLMRGISFEIWLPHGGGSRIDDIIGALTNGGFLPSEEYLRDGLLELARLNTYGNIACIFGLAAMFNFVFVHKGVRSFLN